MHDLKGRHIGLAAGIVLGLVWVVLGTWQMIGVLLLGVIGYVVGGVLGGEIDLQRYIDLLRRK
jgi:hypothetical protein